MCFREQKQKDTCEYDKLGDVIFSACVTPLTSCTVESETPDFTFFRRTIFVALLWLIYLSYISVALFWWCTSVNWASPYMLRLTKKQHKPYSCLYSWITSMADIPESVLLSQAVCIGRTQPYSLSGRSCWFLSYIATVPHMNLYVMLDMLKVNFLQIPSMFTTIQYTARSCWYRSQKFRLLRQIPAISPAENVHGWWEQSDKCHLFLLYHNI